jgi:hypothetical protein
VSSILFWQPLKVLAGSPIRVSITGSVSTRVATRYFWIPVKDQASAKSWTMKDGEPLDFDTTLIKSGQDNRLGFACQVAPVVVTDLNLLVTFEVRQVNTILLEQRYDLQATNPNIPVPLADGISLTF